MTGLALKKQLRAIGDEAMRQGTGTTAKERTEHIARLPGHKRSPHRSTSHSLSLRVDIYTVTRSLGCCTAVKEVHRADAVCCFCTLASVVGWAGWLGWWDRIAEMAAAARRDRAADQMAKRELEKRRVEQEENRLEFEKQAAAEATVEFLSPLSSSVHNCNSPPWHSFVFAFQISLIVFH